jgi:hypothetical protein
MTPADGRRVRTRPAVMVLSLAVLVAVGKLVTGCGNPRPSNLNEQSDGAPQSGLFCVHPYPGCSCGEKGQTAGCGTVTLKSENFVQCSMGTTTCNGTSWGPCDGTVTVSKDSFTGHGVRLVSPQTLTGTTCGAIDPCDPYCEVAMGEGGLTITVAEGGAGDAGPTTTVSGTVFDPGCNVPLANITVYQPTGALIALPDGVACDSCASITSPYSSVTSTDANGNFTLPVTPTAGSANIVMQSGRWRREVAATGLTSGVNNPISVADCAVNSNTCYACNTRLPQTHNEGNIPLLALEMGYPGGGNKDPFECVMAKFMGGIQTNATAAATLSTTPSTLSVNSTTGFNPAGGTFYVQEPGLIAVTYTGLTANSFTGCTTAASTAVGNNDDVFNGPLAEMAPPADNTRVQLYHDTGASYPSPAAPVVTSLYSSQAALNAYTAVILPCPGISAHINPGLTAAEEGYFINYAEAGGGVFADHDSTAPLLQTFGTCSDCIAAAPFNSVSTWYNTGPDGLGLNGTKSPSGKQAKVLGTTPTHTLFMNWLTNVGAYAGGYVTTPQPWIRALDPTAGTTFEWLRGESTDNWTGDPGGDYSATFSFDLNNTATVTPGTTGIVAPGTGCGHVFYNAMHVDPSRGADNGNFPGECSLGPPLSSNEMAFEYLVYALTSCSTAASPPPPPPPPPPTTYTASVQAQCPLGTHVQWGFFEWQATIPTGTNISFTAQTAKDSDAGPAAYGPAVFIGQATATTTTWTTDACIVDGHLQDLAVDANEYGLTPSCITGPAPGYPAPPAGESPQSSQDWLQISMTLNPAGLMVPTLNQWQQLYDCPPDQ